MTVITIITIIRNHASTCQMTDLGTDLARTWLRPLFRSPRGTLLRFPSSLQPYIP